MFHQKFGYGVVKSADDNKLDVEFEKAGFKRVLDNYVQPVSDAEVGANTGSGA